MRSVYKYKVGDKVEIPHNSKLVAVGEDFRGVICVWFEVNPKALTVSTKFAVYATGQEIPDYAHHAGSFSDDNKFIWHVYEV